jgi:hypothetical protein
MKRLSGGRGYADHKSSAIVDIILYKLIASKFFVCLFVCLFVCFFVLKKEKECDSTHEKNGMKMQNIENKGCDLQPQDIKTQKNHINLFMLSNTPAAGKGK